MTKTITYAMAHAKNDPTKHMTFFKAEIEKRDGRTYYHYLTFYGERSVTYRTLAELIQGTIETHGKWHGFSTLPFEL